MSAPIAVETGDAPAPARRTVFFSLLVVAAVATVSRSLRAPVDYPTGSWLVSYEEGLVKRGLVGTLVRPLLAWKSPDEVRFVIQTLSLLVLVGLLAALVAAAFRRADSASDRGQWAFLACGIAFLTSPWVVMAGHLDGFLDHVVELLVVAAVGVAATPSAPLVVLLAILAVLTHELFLVHGLPVIAFALALTKPRNVAFLVPALAVAGLLVALPPSPEEIQRLQDDVRSYGILGRQAALDAVYHLRNPFTENVAAQQGRILARLLRADLAVTVLPSVALFLGWAMVRLWLHGRRLMALAAIPAVAAPLLLHAFAWDAPRFTIMLVFGAFVLLVAVDRVTPTIGARAVTGLALLVTLFHAWWTVPLISGTDFDGEGAFALRTGPTTRTFFDCRPLFENAGFETGELDRWEQKEGEFQIRKAVSDQGGRLRKGTSGTWWASSWDPVAGDRAEGILVSEPFVITGATIIAAVGGGFDKRRLRAALVVDGVEVRSATGRNSNDLRPVAWDTREVVGQTARIEITDRSQDRWGHIDVDGFCFFR